MKVVFDTIEELASCYIEKERTAWVEQLTASADLVFPAERARGPTSDPFDELVLECALAAGPDYLVSDNKKLLLPLREYR